MKRTAKYFSDSQEVKNPHEAHSQWLSAIGATRISSAGRLIGHTKTGPDAIMAITRVIYYSNSPSLHKCDARCTNARGHNCECSCGGLYHGINTPTEV